MVKLKRKAVLLAKVESTYGTDPTPSASTDAILTIDIDPSRTFTEIARNVQIGSLTHKQSVGRERMITVNFQHELVGSGAAATAPRLGALLQACGFAETVNSPTDVTYAPSSTSLKSVTLYIYMDGLLHQVHGAVGTFKLTCAAGQPAILDFTFMGLYEDKTDTAIASPTYESTVDDIPICVSAGLTYNSVSLVVNEVTVDMANQVSKRPSINSSTAIAGFQITDRKPTATIDPEAEAVSTVDFEGDALTTPRELTWTIGDTTGNRCVVTIPKFNITDVQYGDREQTLVETVTGLCSDGGSGDDEITFAFT